MSLQADVPPRERPRIVKAKVADGLGTPIAFNFRDLVEQCDEHLAEVRQHSEQLLNATTAEAERLRKEATEAGRKAGYQAGLKAAEAEVAARVERLAAERLSHQIETTLPAIRQLAEHLSIEQERWIARWEREAIQLAVAISEKLLHRTLTIDPAAADAMIADTLRVAAGTTSLTVRLSPTDLDRLTGSAALRDAMARFGNTAFVGDAKVAPGGCLVETRHGHIDGRLETLLGRIASELCGDDSPILIPTGQRGDLPQ